MQLSQRKDQFGNEDVASVTIKRDREKFWKLGQKTSDRRKLFRLALAGLICVESTNMETII